MRTLYLTDLDGTLLTTRQRISPYTLAVLRRLTERGVLFSYATARSLTSARVVTEGLTPRLPVIVYNGGQIMDAVTGERLLLRQFTPEERAHLRALFQEHGVSPLVYAFVDGMERISWDAARLNPGKRFYLDSRRDDRRLRPLPGPAGLYEGEIFYYTCIGTESELTPLYSADPVRPLRLHPAAGAVPPGVLAGGDAPQRHQARSHAVPQGNAGLRPGGLFRGRRQRRAHVPGRGRLLRGGQRRGRPESNGHRRPWGQRQ